MEMMSENIGGGDRRLEARAVVITGAGTGIGQGMAVALAKEGARIVIVGRSIETLQDTVRQVEAVGGTIRCVQGSVADAETAARAIAEAVSAYGRLDVVINNAHSFTPNLPLDETPEADMRTHFESGFMGTFYFMQAAFPHMKDCGGSIINFGSQAGTDGWANLAPYAATKEAIRGLTRSASRDWGKYKIRVNIISPSSRSKKADEYLSDPEVMKATLATIPLGYIGDPEIDIGPVAVFLASDESRYVTGQLLNANGGM
jgi:NAD(P)-dependent dehydrogenase (short-subunit alcohol dehydrogenase family)